MRADAPVKGLTLGAMAPLPDKEKTRRYGVGIKKYWHGCAVVAAMRPPSVTLLIGDEPRGITRLWLSLCFLLLSSLCVATSGDHKWPAWLGTARYHSAGSSSSTALRQYVYPKILALALMHPFWWMRLVANAEMHELRKMLWLALTDIMPRAWCVAIQKVPVPINNPNMTLVACLRSRVPSPAWTYCAGRVFKSPKSST